MPAERLPHHVEGRERLRIVAERGVARLNPRVSVSPKDIVALLRDYAEVCRQLDEAKALLAKPAGEPVAHKHTRTPGGPIYRHAHPMGERPHGHHGMRYVDVDHVEDGRPRVEL